jgi:predicted Zn-ribbon and HTH transcriptional regulator
MVMGMAQKLRLKVSETLLKKTKGYALFNSLDVESVFNEAFFNWTDKHLSMPDVKRVNAIIPVGEIALKNVREVAKKQGISLVRAVEAALERYLGERKTGGEPSSVSNSVTADANSVTVDADSDAADAESVTADARECHCTACGHAWTPKGKGRPVYCPNCRSKEWDAGNPSRECFCRNCGYQWKPRGKEPAYCPKCNSKEWDKVVICENSCDQPIAPLNTKAGQSNMCEPCYAEMIASWGPEATE